MKESQKSTIISMELKRDLCKLLNFKEFNVCLSGFASAVLLLNSTYSLSNSHSLNSFLQNTISKVFANLKAR